MAEQREASRGRVEIKLARARTLEDELLAFIAWVRELEADLREPNDMICNVEI